MTKVNVSFVCNDCIIQVKGHSGYAEAGSDIVCASVSSMLMLTVNTVTARMGCKADIDVDGDGVSVTAKVYDVPEEAAGLIKQFAREVWELSRDYPENVTVKADFLKGEINNA